ncbi:RNA-binding protein NOB1 [Nephila pilipes]|uniref:RNA-binding protein NOB1 n=1 Tax=Nephila pilipes TaxID=299642 RepID=A0A8X6NT48_NEPPI|nr:RNA-binding protein NOB1 [Nephila pilipes]
MEKRIKYLVVDTGAFINGSPIQELAENIYTVRGVVKEIRDKATLQRLQILSYNLKFQEPSPESCKYVMEFSKKTGDYANLSAVDQQILALTYELEKEHVGTEHLNKVPKCKVTDKPIFCDNQICGFYIPKKKVEIDGSDSEEFENLINNIDIEGMKEKSNLSDNLNVDIHNDVNEEIKKIVNQTVEKDKDGDSKENRDDDTEEDKNDCNEEDKNGYKENKDGVDEKDKDSDNEDDSDNEEDSEDDDEVGWITPQNISQIKEKMEGQNLDSSIVVACVTTDFSVQNALIQMGLNVVSVAGRLVRQARVFILRCYSCYKTTNDITKVFCPNCGNKTLKKVSVTVNEDGTKDIYINFKRRLPTRGLRYCMPLPKGGKHSMNPIVCEDQPIPQNRPGKKALQKINALDEDYVAQSSPFTYNDLTSRAFKKGIRPNKTHQIKGNPNASTKRTGNKKKRS